MTLFYLLRLADLKCHPKFRISLLCSLLFACDAIIITVIAIVVFFAAI